MEINQANRSCFDYHSLNISEQVFERVVNPVDHSMHSFSLNPYR